MVLADHTVGYYQLHNAIFTDTRRYSSTTEIVFTEGVARGEYMSVGGEYLLKLHCVTSLLHGFRFKFIFLLLVDILGESMTSLLSWSLIG